MQIGNTEWTAEIRERNGYLWIDLAHPVKGAAAFGAAPDTVRAEVLRMMRADMAQEVADEHGK